MNNFAAVTLPELIPLITIIAGMLGGFYALIRSIIISAEKERAADRERESIERRALITSATADRENENARTDRFIQAIEDMAASNREIAAEQRKSTEEQRKSTEEMRKGNREAKERNGHLGEQNVQIIELIAQAQIAMRQSQQDLVNKLECLKEQRVAEQVVEHQTISKEAQK